MKLFKKKYSIDYSQLIYELEKGDKDRIEHLLWQPKNEKINYLPITKEQVLKLKKNKNSLNGLTIYKKIEKGRFELLIFNIPYTETDIPYSPIIIDKSNSKIVGIMLPFNELHKHLSNKECSIIGALGMECTSFVIKYRFKK